MGTCVKKAAEWLAAKSREKPQQHREVRSALAGSVRSGTLIQHWRKDDLMTEQ
jgi:hypothetical protein